MKFNIKGFVNNTKMKVKHNSPEILVVIGVVGTVTSTVLACKATTKLSGILEQTKEDVDKIHEASETLDESTYTTDDAKKDLTITYVKTGVEVVKLYAPAAGLSVFSLGCMIKSNNILKKRNMALATALSAVTTGFKEYRSRVVDKYGKEVDQELRFGTKAEKVNSIIIDEDGKEKKVKETINVVDSETSDPYCFIYDESNKNWERDGIYNRMFLQSQQQYANDLLRINKVMTLNQVLDLLGMVPDVTDPRYEMGQQVGWLFDEKNPTGDNWIDFGMFEAFRIEDEIFKKEEVKSGKKINDRTKYEPVVWLEFNVDGDILSMLRKRREQK